MKRLVILAALASGAGLVGAVDRAQAQAPQVCCVPTMRGYQQPAPPPAYHQPAPPPAAYPYPAGGYGQPVYGPPPGQERYPSRGLRGYVGVEYSNRSTTEATDPVTPDVEAWSAEAALSAPVGGFDLQGDIRASRYEGLGGDETWVTSPTLHLFKRTAGGAAGAFVGMSDTDTGTLYAGGLEGQAYLSSATLYGSLGFGRLEEGDVDYDVFAARLAGRYFVSDNFRLDGSVGYYRQTGGLTPRAEAVVAGIGAEYQLSGVPAAIRVGYQRFNPTGAGVTDETIRVGLRWALTGDSLAERDRLGPTMNNITDLFMRN